MNNIVNEYEQRKMHGGPKKGGNSYDSVGQTFKKAAIIRFHKPEEPKGLFYQILQFQI
jgi:hypothetical protein